MLNYKITAKVVSQPRRQIVRRNKGHISALVDNWSNV